MYVVVVCATPAVESPGSCREGAGSIPAVRVAALPKKRLQVPGCSECAPLPTLPGFKTRKPRALPEGAVVRFLMHVSGVGGERKNSEAHLPLPVDPVAACAVVGGGGAFMTTGGIEPPL